MKINSDLYILLDSIRVDGNTSLPYIGNYLKYNEDFGKSDLTGWLYFLSFKLKEYRKSSTLESFKEYLDRLYPPDIKFDIGELFNGRESNS